MDQCDLQDMLLSVPRLKEFVGRNLLAKPNLLGDASSQCTMSIVSFPTLYALLTMPCLSESLWVYSACSVVEPYFGSEQTGTAMHFRSADTCRAFWFALTHQSFCLLPLQSHQQAACFDE